MGCAVSKNADAVLEGTAAADSLRPAASADDVQLKAKSKSSLRKKSKSSNREAETVSAEPEPEPEPPEPPKTVRRVPSVHVLNDGHRQALHRAAGGLAQG